MSPVRIARVGSAVWLLLVCLCAPAAALAQHDSHAAQPPAAKPADEHARPQAGEVQPHAVAKGHTGEDQHEAGVWPLIAKLLNFAILAGVLVYFLRSPLLRHFSNRSGQIRSDLVRAGEMREQATSQLSEIDRRLQALPQEIASLRARGAEEVASEEARLRGAADAERNRLLEQTRREIDMQLRVAKRELVREAAALAIGVAERRIARDITPEDQSRLVDRYVNQVREAQE